MADHRTVTIGGLTYPLRVTMGAMVRFKRVSGRDVSMIGERDVSDLCLFLWCCIQSACSADGVEFGYSFDDFADRLDAESLSDLLGLLTEASGGKKKMPQE